MNTKFSALLLGLALIFSSSSAEAKGKKKEEKKGLCASLPEEKRTEADKVMCLQAQMIEAQKVQREAEGKLKKLATPEERKVMDNIRKEDERKRKVSEFEAAVLNSANLQGCDSDTVLINPLSSIQYIGVGRVVLTRAPFVSVRFNNPTKEAVNIDSSEYGRMVSNLCPGGSITVYRQYRYNLDAGYVRFSYHIIGKEGGTSQDTQEYNMSVDTRGNGTVTPNQPYVWNIVLPRQ